MKKRLKWIIPSGLLMALVISMLGLAATGAWFSDTNQVGPNTVLAGTLQLSVDGDATGGGTFNATNIAPGFQRVKVWKIENTGSIAGFLDVQNIVWQQTGGLDGTGDLLGLLAGRLFVSDNNSPWFETGDVTIYNGTFSGMAANYDANISVPAGGTKYVVLQVNWWSTANDNDGQGDGLQLDLAFELGQTTGQ